MNNREIFWGKFRAMLFGVLIGINIAMLVKDIQDSSRSSKNFDRFMSCMDQLEKYKNRRH